MRIAPALATPPVDTRRGWVVGPWFDAFLIANVAWPLFLVAQLDEGFSGREGLQFWQVYFVTTPHRWVTLLIVFLDRERFRNRQAAFLGVAATCVAVCLGVRLATGTLTCLLAVDYIWNAWHFAAQHHGIFRIYGRHCAPMQSAGWSIEKWSMRGFLLYVILRVAGATWSSSAWDPWLNAGDGFAMVVPVWLIARECFAMLSQERTARGLFLGRIVYLTSVIALYSSLLWAVHLRQVGLVLALATASALFHAIEYLAIVGWSVQHRQNAMPGRLGLLGYLAPRWAIAVGAFALVLGAGGWLLDQHLMTTWLTINVIVAFLHYAYDGMIWKNRPVPALGLVRGDK